MRSNKFSLSLFCSSLVFFIFLVVLVIPFRGPVVYLVVPAVTGIISLSGSLFALSEIRKESRIWYMGIPHSIAVGIVCISGFFNFIRGRQDLAFLTVSLAIISLTSTFFFISFPESQRKVTRLFAGISGIVSLFALYAVYTFIGGILSPVNTSWNAVTGLTALYWMILMPLIGLCYIATAFLDYW